MEVLDGVCYLCLNTEVAYCSIQSDQELAHKIKRVFYFEVKISWEYLATICEECKNRIDDFYSYAKRVARNQAFLIPKKDVQLKTEGQLQKEGSLAETTDNQLFSVGQEVKIDNIDPQDELDCLGKDIENDGNLECRDPQESFYKSDDKTTSINRYNEMQLDGQAGRFNGRKPNKKQVLKQILQHYNLSCEICSASLDDFKDLLKHYKEEHDRAGYLRCCNRKIYQEHYMIEHLRVHVNPATFRCNVCGKTYLSGRNLKDHMKTKHSAETRRALLCVLCPGTFFTKHQHNAHMRTVHKAALCPKCNKMMPSKRAVSFHLQTVHDVGSRFCETCARLFRTEAGLERHLKRQLDRQQNDVVQGNCIEMGPESGSVKETNQFSTDCKKDHVNLRPDCERETKCTKEYTLTDHMLHEAKDKEQQSIEFQDSNKTPKLVEEQIFQHYKLSCNICSMQLTDFTHLQDHYHTQHKVPPYISCCNRKIEAVPCMIEHLQGHMNTETFRCEQCDRRFICRQSLACHEKFTHPSQSTAPFSCITCLKPFDSEESYEAHVRDTHKPTACPECGKIVKRSTLSSHMKRMHFNAKRYVCAICSRVYRSKLGFESHMLRHGKHVSGSVGNESSGGHEMEALHPREKERSKRVVATETQKLENGSQMSDDSQSGDVSLENPNSDQRPTVEQILEHYKLSCDICSVPLANFYELQYHFKTKHGLPGYIRCCNRKIAVRCRMIEHLQYHLNPQSFHCRLCGKNFSWSKNLKEHIKLKHPPEGPKREEGLRCAVCTKQFISYDQYSAHVRFSHKPTPCPQCGKVLSSKSALDNHMRKIHNGTDHRYVCETCARVFRSRRGFESHQKHHQGRQQEDKVQCGVCSIWLMNKYCLHNHTLRMHTHVKGGVRCKLCERTFRNLTVLKCHQKMAHGEARHECIICQKRYKKKSHMREHMAIHHTGEELYKCPYCDERFTSRNKCLVHRKTVHPEEFRLDIERRRLKA